MFRKLYHFLLFVFIFLLFNFSLYAFSPSSSTLYKGIDISEWQGAIDYSKVKSSGIEVVYIRTGEGSTYVDAYFKSNYENAKAAGLKIGFYHYVTAQTTDEAQSQAAFFVSLIKDLIFDCKPAMDFESFGSLTNDQINDIASVFLTTTQKLSGQEVLIYSDTNNAINLWSPSLTSYPLWVAEYDIKTPRNNDKWDYWAGFQYSDSGVIPGIGTQSVDLDLFTEDVFLTPSIPPPPATPSTTSTYIVEPGNTLWSISLHYNTTIHKLTTLNHLSNPNLIYVGQTLLIPLPPSSPTSATPSDSTYVVQPGNTLWNIAQNFNTSINALVNLNHLANPNLIYPGQKLLIPHISSSASTHSTYVVQSGDTLWSIAQQFSTSISTLTSLNHLSNPNLIYPGEPILLP